MHSCCLINAFLVFEFELVVDFSAAIQEFTVQWLLCLYYFFFRFPLLKIVHSFFFLFLPFLDVMFECLSSFSGSHI